MELAIRPAHPVRYRIQSSRGSVQIISSGCRPGMSLFCGVDHLLQLVSDELGVDGDERFPFFRAGK